MKPEIQVKKTLKVTLSISFDFPVVKLVSIFLQTPALDMETKPSQANPRKQMKNSKEVHWKEKEKVLRENQHQMMITSPKTAILTS